ncbi:MAG: transcriptional repressor [Gammaproteobacteria bacterium]|nr:transcriptional repressor [Gammaproteobacteria bacterium]
MNENKHQLPVAREQVPHLLHGCGILPTAQRVEIAAIILSAEQHLSADQVLARLRDTDARVSKATVYNTLGLFAEKGLVREVIVDPTRVFYDSNMAPHYHFYNEDSGTLVDVPSAAIQLHGMPEPPIGTAMTGIDVIVRLRNT